MIDYKKNLNEQQYQAVTSKNGPFLVISGAGSGKTRVLTYRCAYLIDQGVNPSQILLLTFTRKAAEEMTRRASMLLDSRCDRIESGTFHSFAYKICRLNSKKLGYSKNFSIIDQSDAQTLIKLQKEELGYKNNSVVPKPNEILNIISKAKNMRLGIRTIIRKEYFEYLDYAHIIYKIASGYERFKLENNLMDFDDLQTNLVQLLQKDTIRRNLSATYRYIMVDEFQDTNLIQRKILQGLVSEHGNIMAVGDPFQSIYKFRGANVNNIFRFREIFEGTDIINIERNYRSTQTILDFTNNIINAFDKNDGLTLKLFTDKDSDILPFYYEATTSTPTQTQYVVSHIMRGVNNGLNLEDFAVLFRAGYHSYDIEIELTKQKIPYVKYGGLQFVEMAHIKDVISILKTVFYPTNPLAWTRSLMALKWLGAVTVKRLLSIIIHNGQGYEGLKDLQGTKKWQTASLFYDYHRSMLEIGDHEVKKAMDRTLTYYEPLMKEKFDDYHRRLTDFDIFYSLADRYSSMKRLLTDLTLEIPQDKSKVKDHVTLSTIHSAKGLEWDTVFLINVVEDSLPHKMAKTEDDIDEERRLFYVATTRAENNLHMISPIDCSPPTRFYSRVHKEFYSDVPTGNISRFLTEMGDFKKFVNHVNFNGEPVGEKQEMDSNESKVIDINERLQKRSG